MKIQNTTTSTINIYATGMDSISNRIAYKIEGLWVDQVALQALFPGMTFVIEGDKIVSNSIVWVSQLPVIFDQFTVQEEAVGNKVSDETNQMGTKILFQLNCLNLPVDEESVIIGWTLV